ncbi:flagellar hook-basal body complex protein FliE [Rhodanobacter sp. KK11]|jgi:flagellar hook-basal body complex protein FliE|uniref:flagellar hook-basal body complex protein FliE n=1 Tax=Rhodanobacter sp. KK11 TaxID=3083255 RepID=UPI00296649AE|nr:flagellar hook-basal body complex protein FliE [Rhodanobacter sp. KK11]MDW2981773.1 flagellar hook-basal body complex protein FliE [Rhodanobacter sp. KK11]
MIDAITSVTGAMPVPELAPRPIDSTGDFSRLLGEGLGALNTSLNAGDHALRAMAAGEAIPLHDVMIAMERARLDLQFAVEVRNRAVEAYQQLTQMQL